MGLRNCPENNVKIRKKNVLSNISWNLKKKLEEYLKKLRRNVENFWENFQETWVTIYIYKNPAFLWALF